MLFKKIGEDKHWKKKLVCTQNNQKIRAKKNFWVKSMGCYLLFFFSM